MRVHLHTLCWNDGAMLDFFFRHYDPWIDRYYFFDDGSTDGTLERLRGRADVVVAPTPHSDPHSWVRSAQSIYNSDWKRSAGEADWVVVTNLDEHLFHSDMREYLERQLRAGVTIVPAIGYQMVTEEFPTPESVLWRDYPLGAPSALYSRLAIFRPDRFTESNYAVGRHRASFEGNVVLPESDEAMNLHYKYLGFEETRRRHNEQGVRLGSTDRAKGWGAQYDYSDEELKDEFRHFTERLVNVHEITQHDWALSWWRKG